MVRSCASPCGLVCGGVAEAANPDAAAACQACYLGQGCTAVGACLSDPACASYGFCAVEALTPNESFYCSQLLDDGGVDASVFTNLTLNVCAPTCEFNANWSCAGRVTWPSGASGGLTIQMMLLDALSQEAIPGVTAKVCASDDSMCDHPSATEVSAMDGTVTLVQQVDAGPVFTNGYIDLSGGGIVPEVFFWSFPLSLSPATLHPTVITPADVAEVTQGLDVTQDASSGIVYAVGFDCLQIGGSGLTYAIPGAAQVFYQQNGVFLPGLTTTDSSGAAAFLNVPAGVPLTLTASVGDSGVAIGHFPFFVRHGGLAEVFALPQPD
jgi:hypothetical protein